MQDTERRAINNQGIISRSFSGRTGYIPTSAGRSVRQSDLIAQPAEFMPYCLYGAPAGGCSNPGTVSHSRASERELLPHKTAEDRLRENSRKSLHSCRELCILRFSAVQAYENSFRKRISCDSIAAKEVKANERGHPSQVPEGKRDLCVRQHLRNGFHQEGASC